MNDDSPDPARLHVEAVTPVSGGRDDRHGGGLFVEDREVPSDMTEAEPQTDADATADMEESPLPEETVAQSLRMAEALLFASAEPLSAQELSERLPAGIDVPALLEELGDLYRGRGVNLVKVAGKWAFRTAADLSFLMERERVEQRRLSRAALETLAIVAYHQPVTRAEIEAIRGVTVSKGTLDVLMEAGWVKVRGRRQTPGRPVTYGTNEAFLEHFGLEAIGDLPGLEELRAAGLLDTRMPTNISIPTPSDADEDEEAEDDDGMDEADASGEEDEGFDWESFGADVDTHSANALDETAESGNGVANGVAEGNESVMDASTADEDEDFDWESFGADRDTQTANDDATDAVGAVEAEQAADMSRSDGAADLGNGSADREKIEAGATNGLEAEMAAEDGLSGDVDAGPPDELDAASDDNLDYGRQLG